MRRRRDYDDYYDDDDDEDREIAENPAIDPVGSILEGVAAVGAEVVRHIGEVGVKELGELGATIVMDKLRETTADEKERHRRVMHDKAMLARLEELKREREFAVMEKEEHPIEDFLRPEPKVVDYVPQELPQDEETRKFADSPPENSQTCESGEDTPDVNVQEPDKEGEDEDRPDTNES